MGDQMGAGKESITKLPNDGIELCSKYSFAQYYPTFVIYRHITPRLGPKSQCFPRSLRISLQNTSIERVRTS